MENILYITRPFRPIYRLLHVRHVNSHVMNAHVIVFSPKEQHFEMLWVPAHDIRSRVKHDLLHFLKHPQDYLPSVQAFRQWLRNGFISASGGSRDPEHARAPDTVPKRRWHKRLWSFARSSLMRP